MQVAVAPPLSVILHARTGFVHKWQVVEDSDEVGPVRSGVADRFHRICLRSRLIIMIDSGGGGLLFFKVALCHLYRVLKCKKN